MTGTETGAYAPTLVVTGGSLDGKKLVCPPSVEKILGTGPSCNFKLEGANVDAEHARIVWEMRGLLLADLGSRSGTFVNGERVDEQTLNEGDRICLGPPGSRQSVKLVVRMGADIAMAAGSGQAAAFPSAAEREASATIAVNVSELDLDGTLPLGRDGVSAPTFDESPLVLDAEDQTDDLATLPPRGPSAPTLIATAAPTLLGDELRVTPGGEELVLIEPEPEPEPETLAIPAPVFEATTEMPSPMEPSALPETRAMPVSARANLAPPRPEPEASPAPEPAPGRRQQRPDYTDELPSIAPVERADSTAVAAPVPRAPSTPAKVVPAPRPAPRGRHARPAVPRVALVAAGALALALGAWALFGLLHKNPPAVLSIVPPKVEPGGTITLTGSGFAPDPVANVVRFGEQPAQVTSASDTRLVVTVPALDLSQGSRNVPVTVQAHGLRTGGLFVKVVALPKVTSLLPDVALPGAEVVASGRNLKAERVSVSVGGTPAEVLEAQGERLRFRVPDLPVVVGKRLPVALVVGGESTAAPELTLGRLPMLLAAEPAAGPIGARVVLRGRGFAPEPDANEVLFLGRRALVLAASATELTVVMPGARAFDAQVPVTLSVSVAGSVSNALEFLVMNPVATTFLPRFFAAPADAPGQAFVATQLGPLLLIGDQGAGPSLAARAAGMADALNALCDAWTAGAAGALQTRDQPRPSVWAPGAQSALLEVWPGDVAAYDRRSRGGSGGARRLANFWAALIEDYLTLFVQGQRPSRVSELSSRGRLLLDLYAEAMRRGASGVPRNLVLPPSAALEAGLRDMALQPEGSPGARAAGRAATPIEGVWEGTIEDDAGRRGLAVTLRLVSGRLQGEATTRSRGLAMSIPLSDLSYERGAVAFTLLAGGVPRRFTGTLQGARIAGQVRVPGRKDPIGSFSLDFVQ